MLHCSHEHDRMNATDALQLDDKQPICGAVACDTTSREKILSAECENEAAASPETYAIVWMIPPSARSAAPFVAEASRELT